MSALVRISTVGLDEATYDQLAPVLHPLLKAQPGFFMHVAYPIPGGFAVGEVWESKDQHETWFNGTVKPNVPNADAMSTEYFELHSVIQP